MEGFSIRKILSSFRMPEIYIKRVKQEDNLQGNSSFNSNLTPANNSKEMVNQPIVNNILQMNMLLAVDRSVYIKNLLGLPQNLADLLRCAQSNTPVEKNTLLSTINEDFIKNQKILSQIFDENIETLPEIVDQMQTTNIKQDTAALIFGGMIRMTAISEIILKNSKQAAAELVIAMASSSKNGIKNDQIQETLSVINSCISLVDSNNPSQTLKSLMLLYLPWLPLNDEVGFDIEIESQEGENELNDSKLTVLIQTKNFGNVKGVFTLTTSNSVDAYIICAEDFPKNILKKELLEESHSHSMNTTVDIEAVEPQKVIVNQAQETKVNLSATNEMNPYLLLIAHSFIRIVIQIDSNLF